MAQRPTLLDLRSKSSSSNMTSASKPLRSPRLHVAGEIPPELSPLDAFALQSRLLARQLKESDNAGRRMSRLPPLTTESPLVMQGRSDYFRSMSQDGMSEASQSPEPLDRGLGLMPEVEENLQRPMSMHPRMSRIPPTPDDGIPLPPQPMLDQTRGRTLNHIREDSTNFGARREESPTPMESAQLDEPSSSVVPSPRKDTAASLPMPSSSNSLVASPEKMPKKHSFDGPGLAPPRPMFVKRPSASSTMSSPLVPTDEDGVMSSSFHSLPHRKLSSGSAMSNDEGQVKQGKHVDVLDRKTRKAQFALAVYELGVSHMNGWGIEQDKVLALRCFEIAGSWGDLDALAEAGYCYAQGVGCKKDLKKAAKFYREAESKGMSMVGNSWIHKSKYNDDSKELKKVRSKSRTRNIFGIKTGGS
ncbi:hypothetical protein VDGE_04255 [Verticillium dahliae]|uniref:Cell cycle inhibitor Nif1 n=1 Tax=Verticillium dahliae TaxID=27337 RepID=A0A444S378_VERDA|nr:hypothetical protein VDGE_04255 [Verticillium dahliae]